MSLDSENQVTFFILDIRGLERHVEMCLFLMSQKVKKKVKDFEKKSFSLLPLSCHCCNSLSILTTLRNLSPYLMAYSYDLSVAVYQLLQPFCFIDTKASWVSFSFVSTNA